MEEINSKSESDNKVIIIVDDNIEMVIGRNYFRERINFVIGMVCVIFLLIGIILIKSFFL